MEYFADESCRNVHIRREKDRARRMRKSSYWQAKVQRERRCYYCQTPLTLKEATLDHIVPISCGGKTQKGNIAISCKSCNTEKKARTPVEWLIFQ